MNYQTWKHYGHEQNWLKSNKEEKKVEVDPKQEARIRELMGYKSK